MSAAGRLVSKEGFIPKGCDVHRAHMTLAEAHAWCLEHDECRGFTYQLPPDAGARVHVWFKSTDKVAPGQGWMSVVKEDAPAKGGLEKAGAPKRTGLAGLFGSPTAGATDGPRACAGLALLTRKPLHFSWWMDYHIALGISHFFIHVEDTPELLPLLQSAPYRDLVTISVKGDASHFKDNYWTLQDRQRAHVNAALALCRAKGIDWLFHVDDDELIWLDRPFAQIVAGVPKGVTNLTFSNLEAIPTTMEPVNYFEHIEGFTKKRMLAYVNGKPAGRTVVGTKLDGPHRFSGPSHAVPVEHGVVLHYESCDFNQWCGKFLNQVDCTPERKASIPFPYYRDSITLFQQHPNREADLPRWQEFYQRRKIDHYKSPDVKAATRHIRVEKRVRMIDPLPGAAGAAADAPALPGGVARASGGDGSQEAAMPTALR